MPDSIPDLPPCYLQFLERPASLDLNLLRYLHSAGDLEQLEAYWADWYWLNDLESNSDTLLVFDFGPDNYLLPFMLDDGFFPGAVHGKYAVWNDGRWLCGGEIDHYSIEDLEIQSDWDEKSVREYLIQDFQGQFWKVVSDSLHVPISPAVPAPLRSR